MGNIPSDHRPSLYGAPGKRAAAAPDRGTVTESHPPFFSVVIPVYNRARVLRNALASVLEQSYQDFEIVVVDDGSNDHPERVVEELQDPRIRILRQNNRGGGAARNAGIDAARGRFIAFLDSDDRFLPAHLETMRGLVEGTHGLVAYARVITDRGQGRSLLKPPRAIGPHEDMAIYLLCGRGFVPTITTVVETSAAKRVRYHEALRASEDTDFAIRLYLDGCRFVMAEEPGAVWIDHPDPARSSAVRDPKQFFDWIEGLKPHIPERAYYGARGWQGAKAVSRHDLFRALGLYLTAVKYRCYRPRLAAIIFLQIVLPASVYRFVADCAVGARGTRLASASPTPRASLPAHVE
jgi:glycosyltransferase involved in cell wall biosynthesis